MLADPRFLFIVCAEVGIDAGAPPAVVSCGAVQVHERFQLWSAQGLCETWCASWRGLQLATPGFVLKGFNFVLQGFNFALQGFNFVLQAKRARSQGVGSARQGGGRPGWSKDGQYVEII